MPRKVGLTSGSFEAPILEELRARGIDSPMLDLRLDYMALFKLRSSYIAPLLDATSIFPNALPTQSSLRWSWTNPPITTFPEAYRDVVIPDDDEYWIGFDWDAIEGRIVACKSHDPDELAAFRRGDDIHLVNVCRIMGWDLPPVLVEPFKAPENTEWFAQHRWTLGKDDPRRKVAKVVKYALQYARTYMGVMETKDLEALGIDRPQLLAMAKGYWRAKTHLLRWKQATWERVWSSHVARTRQGLRRMLMGQPDDVMKQGANHEIQGDVALEMNRTLLAIHDRWAESSLGWQSHDGAILRFPVTSNPWPEIKTLVEYHAVIDGEPMQFTASWKVIPPGGGPPRPPETWFNPDGGPGTRLAEVA
jgi:hypothetical protein